MNLVLVRHGQSEWNALNLFTGWKDPGLTDQGRQEANQAGQLIQSLNLDFDVMFTSALVRAQLTGDIILNIIKQTHIPTIKNQALNERNYGDLAGLNKDDARAKWGAEQVQIWRRSYDTPPPGGESLKDTGERVMPYFNQEILPLIKKGQNILISAHGNSLRSMIKFLDNISDTEIVKLEIPTGAPIHFTFNEHGDVDSRTDLF
ncbi:MAG: 2,3-bisphosphoglycerate-dependent phosphoglycerate mutase [Pseudomonadota bacterium]|nr:2,3-bisphosphoglycerate-dependent phosphoglycerate mutase [Pseudomonadota bacterium]MEC7999814.1 2,3-bisphosphoglycerate-dependent phosphoglycerate mutase [Pseudomonadota bacterium]|tara:strand:+ start:597 stop:1208 length:612 start_codon:yes stop_codon:yes gene_type:complete